MCHAGQLFRASKENTAGTGRFNLAQGTIGATMGVAASPSTSVSGFVFQEFGRVAGFLIIAAIAASATAAAWMVLPETKPEKYQDCEALPQNDKDNPAADRDDPHSEERSAAASLEG